MEFEAVNAWVEGGGNELIHRSLQKFQLPDIFSEDFDTEDEPQKPTHGGSADDTIIDGGSLTEANLVEIDMLLQNLMSKVETPEEDLTYDAIVIPLGPTHALRDNLKKALRSIHL